MITVCIMSYKYAHLASQAIESVLSQTRKPDRILIVDDGANDGIDKLAEMYGIESVIRERNLGIANNFDDILKNHVHTDKVMFIGADNWIRPDTLEILDRVDADIVSYDISLFGEEAKDFAGRVNAKEVKDGYHIWRFTKKDINKDNYIHGSSLYNAALAKKYGYKPSGQKNSEEDWMLWKEMLNNGATHTHIPEAMLYYRRHKLNFQR